MNFIFYPDYKSVYLRSLYCNSYVLGRAKSSVIVCSELETITWIPEYYVRSISVANMLPSSSGLRFGIINPGDFKKLVKVSTFLSFFSITSYAILFSQHFSYNSSQHSLILISSIHYLFCIKSLASANYSFLKVVSLFSVLFSNI